jgi:drug/metabolite transporter (DMT)-like permease
MAEEKKSSPILRNKTNFAFSIISCSTLQLSKSSSQHVLGFVLVLAGALLFSVKAILVKLAYRYPVDSVSLLALRMLFSLPFYLLVGTWVARNRVSNFPKTKLSKEIIFMGLMGYYFASLFDFLGLKFVTAGIERLVLYIYPTIVLVITAFFWKQKIQTIQYIALLLTYLGVGIAFLDKAAIGESENFWLGTSLIACAAITYAIYIAGTGKLLPLYGTFRYTILTMSVSCAAILLHHALFFNLQLFHFPPQVYVLSLLMAFFSTVLPSFFMAEGIRLIGSNHAAIIGSIGPISTIVLAYFVLGESFGLAQFIGTVIVVIGVLLLSFKK